MIQSSHFEPEILKPKLKMLRIIAIILCNFLQIQAYAFPNSQNTLENNVEIFPQFHSNGGGGPYSPTWTSLDARPLPEWYDKGKIGVKVSWGVSSVPSFRSEWFWYSWKGPTPDPKSIKFMRDNYQPRFTYQDFARDFTAEFFDPLKWAEIVKKSGAKYVVFTSKHHDGYALYPSKYSFGWNSMDVGPQKDLIKEFANAIRNTTDVKFGLYHSLYEWFHPLYLKDKENNFKTNLFVTQKVLLEMKEMVEMYKPEVIWSDGDWETSDEYWKSKEFLAWLYNSSPVKDTVVVNDRWGNGTSCKHGGVWNCQDRYNPGQLMPHKFENAMTIDKHSWCHRRNAELQDFLSPEEIIEQLVITVACGGNFLINVGPTKDGVFPIILQERLSQLGHWLGINGPAIYETSPWSQAQNDSVTKHVWYTTKPKERKLFAIILKAWEQTGDENEILLGSVDSHSIKIKSITMLGLEGKLNWKPCSKCDQGIFVTLPRSRKGDWAWTLVIVF